MAIYFPKSFSVPASQNNIASFIAYLFKAKYSPSTITSNLSAIAYMHKIAGYDDPSNSFFIKKLLTGARNLGSNLDVRLPITLDI